MPTSDVQDPGSKTPAAGTERTRQAEQEEGYESETSSEAGDNGEEKDT